MKLYTWDIQGPYEVMDRGGSGYFREVQETELGPVKAVHKNCLRESRREALWGFIIDLETELAFARKELAEMKEDAEG